MLYPYQEKLLKDLDKAHKSGVPMKQVMYTGAGKSCFRLRYKNPPRTWTKNQWKGVYRWLRVCKRIIERGTNHAIR